MLPLLGTAALALAALSDDERKARLARFALGDVDGMLDRGELDLAIAYANHVMVTDPRWPDLRHDVEKLLNRINGALTSRSNTRRLSVLTHGIMITAGWEERKQLLLTITVEKIFPASGWVVDPMTTVWILVIADGYLVGATTNANGRYPKYWELDSTVDPGDDATIERVVLPATLAERILMQGSGQQYFSDGYEAAYEISSYPTVVEWGRSRYRSGNR